MKYSVKFENSETIEVEADSNLSECSDVTTSPILFGCRTGICSTCLVAVKSGIESLSPPSPDEQELLNIIAPGNELARLACQFKVNGDITLEYLGK